MKYNVVLMAPTPPPMGGIGKWTNAYLSICNNYDIKTILVDENARYRDVFGKNRINLFKELQRTMDIWKEEKNAIKIFKGDCVVHCCIPSLLKSMIREYRSAKIAKKYGAKFIIHFRSTVSQSATGLFSKFFLKKICKLADKIILLNDKSKDYINSLYNNKKMVVVPNFAFVVENNRKTVYSKKIKKVFYVGGIIETKGAKIIADVAEKMPDLQFDLFGAADNTCENYINSKKINNLALCGIRTQEELNIIRKDYDLFLFPTFFAPEGFSNALVEAMSTGLPCIATDWAANKDMIGAFPETIVPIKDSNSIVSAIKKLQNEGKLEEIGNYNYERVKKEYNSDLIMKKYCSIYNELLK